MVGPSGWQEVKSMSGTFCWGSQLLANTMKEEFMRTMVVLCLVMLLLMGCAQKANVKPSTVDHERRDSFDIGKIQEKTVGEVMLFRIDGFGYRGFVAAITYSAPDLWYGPAMSSPMPAIDIGSEWAIIGRLDNGGYLLSKQPPALSFGGRGGSEYCIIADARGRAYADTPRCNLSRVDIREWNTSPANILVEKEGLIYKEGSVKQELVYTGKSRDSIRLQYREYKDNLARPAFYQDLSYDLIESNIISFRNMVIEVIEARNSLIKFIVKKGLD